MQELKHREPGIPNKGTQFRNQLVVSITEIAWSCRDSLCHIFNPVLCKNPFKSVLESTFEKKM
jgi:hypothetical protein